MRHLLINLQVLGQYYKDTVDIANMKFEIDELQNQLINRYLPDDINFRRAFFTDFTMHFLKMIFDKVNKLHEPVSLSILGIVRSGKSTGAITTARFIKGEQGKKLEPRN